MVFSIDKNRTSVFNIAYSFILAFSFFGEDSVYGPLLKSLTYISMGIFIVLFFTNINRFTYNELARIVVITLFTLIVAFVSQSSIFIKLMLFTLAFKGVDFRSCIKYDIKLRFFLIILIYGLYSVGILEDVASMRGDIVRHSYGFSNPNALAMAITILCMEFLYVYHADYFKLKVLFVIFLSYIASLATDSRTSLYIIIIYIFLTLCNKYFPRIIQNILVYRIFQITPFVIFALTIYLIQLYLSNSSSIEIMALNSLGSGRLAIAAKYFEVVPLTIFGANLINYSTSSLMDIGIDNAYISILLSQGVVIFTLFFAAYTILIKKLYRIKEFNLMFIFFSLFIMGIGERLWTSVDYNILMIALSTLLYDRQNKWS